MVEVIFPYYVIFHLPATDFEQKKENARGYVVMNLIFNQYFKNFLKRSKKL